MRALGLLSSRSRPKGRYSQCPPFPLLKVGASLVGENTVLLNLEWRQFNGLRELMHALNACLDTKRVGITCFLTSVSCLRLLRGSATGSFCQ